MKRIHHLLLACSLFLLRSESVFAGGAKHIINPSGGDWEISISAGPAYRIVGDIRINGGYRSAGLALPSFVGGNSSLIPSVGDTGAPFDREYNDGFVRQDGATPIDGSTWNWGYDSSEQVQNGQLIYQATGFQSVYSEFQNAPSSGPSRRDQLEGIAPHLQIDARGPHHLGPFRVGFAVGMDFVKTDRTLNFSNFAAGQTRADYRVDYVDRYELNGIVPPLAPYEGSFGGPGPIIGNLPWSREITPVLLLTDNASFANQVSSSFDLDAWTFTFGPTLSTSEGPLDLTLSGGLTLSIYSWEAVQNETLRVTTTAGTMSVAQWSEKNDGIKIRPGVYLQGEAGYSISESIGMSGFLRLDAAESFRVGVGPTTYKIKPCGVTAGLMFRFELP